MYDAISANRVRTVVLVAVFIAIVAAIGYIVGELTFPGAGLTALPFAVGLASVSSVGAYFGGDQLVLAQSRAREIAAGKEPLLRNTVEALAIGLGIPTPKIFVIEDPAPNAFATGRDPKHASIAVTRGLLEKLDKTELEGVLAHELSHVGNYDIRLMLLVAVLVGTIALLSDWILRTAFYGGRRRDRDRGSGGILLLVGFALALLTPVIAALIQMAVSRQREYLADASGALLTRYPQGLANALRKIAADPVPLAVANKATAALWIWPPLKEHGAFMDGLFDTHPPIAERIRRLEAMG
ncbi:MAG: M48 family metallopeptidase [Chloroflexi bacterium]|nr:M48 family metallopeptidase [Chloroflexota bacterium]